MFYWMDCVGFSSKDRFLLKGPDVELYFKEYGELFNYCKINNIDAKQV
jgi:hypothetical protein